MFNIADGLENISRSKPNSPAIIEGEKIITYGELAQSVRGIASGFVNSGLPAGAIVGIALEDNSRYLVILYALARAGYVILPIDCRWTPAEQARVASHFKAHYVLVEAGHSLPDNVPVQHVDDTWYRAMLASDPIARFVSDGSAPLLLSLSSGTTGRSKGPLVTHDQFVRRFMTHWIDLGFTTHDTYVSATPLYFGGGRSFCLSTLFCGGKVVLFPPPFKMDALLAEIERTRATTLFLVPTMIRRLLDLADESLAPMRGLKTLLVSDAPLTPQERAAIRERICPNFYEYYAATEGGGISLLTPSDQDIYTDSVGRPIFAVEVEIVDDDGQVLPPGEVGLLRYRGPGVATSFHLDEEASKESFRDGWFYPGDLAERNAEGYVFIRGRRKDMIIRGGVNIYPNEVEAALLAHPAVSDAAVVGWASREFGEEVVAFVRIGKAVASEELSAWCAGQLAPYKRPKAIIVVDDFPRNSSGKTVKSELKTIHQDKVSIQ